MYAEPSSWEPSVLDVGHDDYYLTGRSDIPDLSRSVFWTPYQPIPRRRLGGSWTAAASLEAGAQQDPSTQPASPGIFIGRVGILVLR
jgi:hypothetical protein